ncbi:2-amino-4-hydroxy-6-hydroxymethyldihydropteridinediphosphokinase [Gracilibacillus ureilyticus]|uniref:2-amino-4-hydroxy-6-hydroxymethyldihydropteridine diphosphokinase n=2 Tax=Gracilibacillus ureilyticus TaxID=531814 RepID=A0A1H9VLU3_9BACI|nr:2-amino-4-hydroxy-6-hydroxymethyldihydropteridine diphosphokinase [Gracilibacillus ureilyticus]SES22534.1 2-amino-4-hydroxy-6-hydroxymethyldihydropteridinediphosphokinase [Gracilibacillus ureilyticus]
MKQVFIALGSNIEPRLEYIEKAEQQLKKDNELKMISSSSVYETEPVGYTDQSAFLNKVIKVETTLEPVQLLNLCQKIELELGRKREIRWGPRTIDLDILLYNQENIKTDRLTLPHPFMHERAFVLIPLREISPDLFLPHVNKHISNLIDELALKDRKGVVKWQHPGGGIE